MARTKRNCPADEVFHVLNRAVARLTIFEKPEDYAALYGAAELEDLYKSCRREEFAITTTHFRVLIGLKKKADRTKLVAKAIKDRLSVSDLRRLARKKNGPESHPGGRKPDLVRLINQKDGRHFKVRLHEEIAKWHGMLTHLLVRSDDIDPCIAKLLKELQASIVNVRNACKK